MVIWALVWKTQNKVTWETESTSIQVKYNIWVDLRFLCNASQHPDRFTCGTVDITQPPYNDDHRSTYRQKLLVNSSPFLSENWDHSGRNIAIYLVFEKDMMFVVWMLEATEKWEQHWKKQGILFNTVRNKPLKQTESLAYDPHVLLIHIWI